MLTVDFSMRGIEILRPADCPPSVSMNLDHKCRGGPPNEIRISLSPDAVLPRRSTPCTFIPFDRRKNLGRLRRGNKHQQRPRACRVEESLLEVRIGGEHRRKSIRAKPPRTGTPLCGGVVRTRGAAIARKRGQRDVTSYVSTIGFAVLAQDRQAEAGAKRKRQR